VCDGPIRCECWKDGFARGRSDYKAIRARAEKVEAGWERAESAVSAEMERAEKAEAKFTEMMDSEHALSDAYVRLRVILGAMNPPRTTRDGALFEYVENIAADRMIALGKAEARVREVEAGALPKDWEAHVRALRRENAERGRRIRELEKEFAAAQDLNRRLEAELRQFPWRATGDRLRVAQARCKRMEEAMSRNPPPDSGLPQALAVHAEWGWNEAYAHIRRKAGLDAPDSHIDAQLADLFKQADRHCRDCRNHVQGLPNPQCDQCSFPERTHFAAKEADRGPKGEPGKPAAIWVCGFCHHAVNELPDGEPAEWCSHDGEARLCHSCCATIQESRLRRHVWDGEKFAPEEKP